MADKKSPRTPLMLSPEALFRYQIVSAVKARERSRARARMLLCARLPRSTT
jgi:hypothetical protein